MSFLSTITGPANDTTNCTREFVGFSPANVAPLSAFCQVTPNNLTLTQECCSRAGSNESIQALATTQGCQHLCLLENSNSTSVFLTCLAQGYSRTNATTENGNVALCVPASSITQTTMESGAVASMPRLNSSFLLLSLMLLSFFSLVSADCLGFGLTPGTRPISSQGETYTVGDASGLDPYIITTTTVNTTRGQMSTTIPDSIEDAMTKIARAVEPNSYSLVFTQDVQVPGGFQMYSFSSAPRVVVNFSPTYYIIEGAWENCTDTSLQSVANYTLLRQSTTHRGVEGVFVTATVY